MPFHLFERLADCMMAVLDLSEREGTFWICFVQGLIDLQRPM
jgi:hypothetical protein